MSAAPKRPFQSKHLGGVFGDPEGKAGYFNVMDCCSMSRSKVFRKVQARPELSCILEAVCMTRPNIFRCASLMAPLSMFSRPMAAVS